MPASFTSETFSPDRLQVEGPFPAKGITLASGQNLPRGAVLGKITASGKYVLSLSAASDGSQTPDMILSEATDASAGDAATVAYMGGSFADGALTYGTGHSYATAFAPLRDVGILIVKPLS